MWVTTLLIRDLDELASKMVLTAVEDECKGVVRKKGSFRIL